ncbi:MAG: UMP kinase [Candidatus Gracilibacteria bacterium]|jgi:uridylate kinase
MAKLKYKRILLKMSGEVFKGKGDAGIDGGVLMEIAKEIKKLQDMGCEIGIVIGGGNIWRYRDNTKLKLSRVVSDMMGMMATVMNALALENALKQLGAKATSLTSFPAESAIKTYTVRRGLKYMNRGEVVVFAGGTGSPFFTTDSAAALRALELNCDALLKATKVDFVYDKDPMKFKNAKKFTSLKYKDVIEKNLGVMDLTCASLLDGKGIPMIVFNLSKKGNIEKVVKGEKVGTIIN